VCRFNVTAKQFFNCTSLVNLNSDKINDFPYIFCSFSQTIKKNVFLCLIAKRYMELKQDEVTRGAFEDYIKRSFIVSSSCQILPVYYAWWQFNSDNFLCFVDRSFPYYLFQMKPTRCTLLLSIFISTSLYVSGNYVPITSRSYCIYATLVFFTLYGWVSGLQTRHPPIQSEKYQCCIDTVTSAGNGHIVSRNT